MHSDLQDDLKRVRKEEVPRDRKWHLPGVYEIEHQRIETWLRRKAREALAGAGTTVENALDAAVAYSMAVRAIFAIADENRDGFLLERARLGRLEEEAPSDVLRVLLTCMIVVAMGLETAVFVAIYLLDPGNLLVIASGVILAVGSWLSGHGAGNLLGFRDEEGRLVRSGGLLNWLTFFGGAAIVLGIGVLRAGGEEGAVFVVGFTTILALAIILLEAMRVTLSSKYKNRVSQMFLCQAWYSTERHLENAKNDLWKSIYVTEVRRLKREADITLGPED